MAFIDSGINVLTFSIMRVPYIQPKASLCIKSNIMTRIYPITDVLYLIMSSKDGWAALHFHWAFKQIMEGLILSVTVF